MTSPSLEFLVPGIGPAGLPLPLDGQVPSEIGSAATRSCAAGIEPASRAADAGDVEFDSWIARLRHAVQ